MQGCDRSCLYCKGALMGQRRWREFAFGQSLYASIGRVPVEGLPVVSIVRHPTLVVQFVVVMLAAVVNPFMSCLELLKVWR